MAEGNFRGLDAGSETRRYGDYYYGTVASGESIDAGQLVKMTSDGVAVTTANSDRIFGVAYIDAEAGEQITVKTNGGVVARTDGTVSKGNGIQPSGSTNGVATSGGDQYVATKVGQDSDSNDVADLSK